MEKVIFLKKRGIYWIKKVAGNMPSEYLYNLGSLFTENMNEFFLDLLKNDYDYSIICGESVTLRKNQHNAHIYNELSLDEQGKDPNEVIIPISELIKALKKWQELKHQNYDEIMLEKQGKKLTLTGIMIPEEIKNPPVFAVPLTKKKDTSSYNTEKEYPDEPYNQILLFLVYDCQNTPVQRWIDFLNNSKKKYKKGETAKLEKIDDIVHVSYFIPKVYREDPSRAFTLTKKRLIQLIHEWDFLVKSNPEQINVIFDHGNVRLEL